MNELAQFSLLTTPSDGRSVSEMYRNFVRSDSVGISVYSEERFKIASDIFKVLTTDSEALRIQKMIQADLFVQIQQQTGAGQRWSQSALACIVDSFILSVYQGDQRSANELLILAGLELLEASHSCSRLRLALAELWMMGGKYHKAKELVSERSIDSECGFHPACGQTTNLRRTAWIFALVGSVQKAAKSLAANNVEKAQQDCWTSGSITPLLPFASSGRKNVAIHAYQRLELWLIVLSKADQQVLRLFQTPKNVHRHLITREDSSPMLWLFCDIAECIQDLYETNATVDLNIVARLLQKIDSLGSLMHWVMAQEALIAVARSRQLTNLVMQLEERCDAKAREAGVANTFGGLRRIKLDAAWNDKAASDSMKLFKSPQSISGLSLELAVQAAAFKVKSLTSSRTRHLQIQQEAMHACATIIANMGASGHGVLQKILQIAGCLEASIPEDIRFVVQSTTVPSHAMPASTVEKIFQSEFDKTPQDIFAEWESDPFATGSIGQVHRARLKTGEEVAVKVQYEDITKRITRDFRQLSALAWIASPFLKGLDLRHAISSWKNLTLGETDYVAEAANQEYARKVLAEESDIIVPKTFPELCGRKILTQEFIHGIPFQTFCEQASQQDKNRLGSQLLYAHFRLGEHDRFNSDVHPGNYFACDGKLALVDFGQFIVLSKSEFSLKEGILASRSKDETRLYDSLMKSGFHTPKVRAFMPEMMDLYRTVHFRPFLAERNFRFTTEFAQEVLKSQYDREIGIGVIKVPPGEQLSALRLFWSLYSLLGQLNAENEWGKVFDAAIR